MDQLERICKQVIMPTNLWAVTSGVTRRKRKVVHSPPSGTQIKNTWSYTSTSLYSLMACCLTLQLKVFRYRGVIKTETILFLYLLPLNSSFHCLIPPLIYLPFLFLLPSFSTLLPLLLSSASSSLFPRLHSPPLLLLLLLLRLPRQHFLHFLFLLSLLIFFASFVLVIFSLFLSFCAD
jgi:hypothetical protein